MPRPTVHLVHGFNVFDRGAATVARLRPAFEAAGFDVRVHGYRWTFLLTLRCRNRRIAATLAQKLKPGDIVIGHSNGCLIAQLAFRLLDRQRQLAEYGAIFIQPALPAASAWPRPIAWAHVVYCPTDVPLRWAGWMGDYLPWGHPWGDMGRDGPERDGERVTAAPAAELVGEPTGHSGLFDKQHVGRASRKLAELAYWRHATFCRHLAAH